MNYRGAKLLRSLVEWWIHRVDNRPVLPSEEFPWGAQVEAYHQDIKSEVLQLFANLEKIPNFNSILPGQRALKQDDEWKSFFLVALGKAVPEHQKLCPHTTKALANIPGVINAFFSILRPGVHIPAHRGPYSGILRYHLGVIIPEGDVGIRVDKEVCRWQEGRSLYFDDSFDHEAWNKSEGIRVVLFVDAERSFSWPLSWINRQILSVFARSEAAQYGLQNIFNRQL